MERRLDDQFRFVESEIKDPKSLGWMLRYSPDAGSQHLRRLLDEPTLADLETALSGEGTDAGQLLVEVLNRLLESPHLYSRSAFEKIDITETGDLSLMSAHELARFNRQLLQHVYSDYVVHSTELEPVIETEAAVASHSVAVGSAGRDVHVIIGTGNTIETIFAPPESLSEFELTKEDIERVRESFVKPLDFDKVERQAESERLIWIVGPSEVGKRTLSLYLAHSKRQYQSVYEIRGTRAWSTISEASVRGSVVLLTNALYLTGTSVESETASVTDDALDEGELEDEEIDSPIESEPSSADIEPVKEFAADEPETLVHPIQRLLNQGNTVLITSTEELFNRAGNDPGLAEVLLRHPSRVHLSHASYGRAERLKLIRKAINLAHEKGLSAEVKQWAQEACDKLEEEDDESNSHPIFTEWLPGEIVSFIISILASSKNSYEVEAELKVSLNRRLHSWFMQLSDESTRCFVFARAIFPELEERELDAKLKKIIEKLKETYDVNLMPLSVYGYSATPYISASRPFRFINPHVLRAATDVVAEYYIEPFRQLCPLLQEWSTPPQLRSAVGSGSGVSLSKAERDHLIAESAQLRDAIARMAGSVARYDLNGVRMLLDHWASHPLGRIGQAAGIALRYTLLSKGNFEQVFRVVEDWAGRRSSDAGSFQKRSAADALWRLIAVRLQPPQVDKALKLLRHLAGDPNAYVRRTVAHAASQVAGVVEITKTRDLLEHLAADSKEEVRTYMALCLAVMKVDRNELRSLLKEWVKSGNSYLVDAALLYLLSGWGRYDDRTLLYQVLPDHEAAFQKAIKIANKLALQRRGGAFSLRALRSIINDLAVRDDEVANRQAVAALSDLRRAAHASDRRDVESYVGDLVKTWESSQNSVLRLSACVYHFDSAQNAPKKLEVLIEKFGSFAHSAQVTQQIAVAKWLNWRSADRLIAHQAFQEWLITGNNHAIATVVFYWLLATNDSEPERLDHLTAIRHNFPLGFEQALPQAADFLPSGTIAPLLRRLIIADSEIAREQLVMALRRVEKRNSSDLYRLLEDWLIDDDAKVGAAVVFYWLASADHTQEQRYESLKGILSAFPMTFAQGIRDAVRILGPHCITPQLSELLY